MDDAIKEETTEATEQRDVTLANLDKSNELDEWVTSVIDKKEDFLENGAELLELAIEDDRPDLIEIIYSCTVFISLEFLVTKNWVMITTRINMAIIIPMFRNEPW